MRRQSERCIEAAYLFQIQVTRATALGHKISFSLAMWHIHLSVNDCGMSSCPVSDVSALCYPCRMSKSCIPGCREPHSNSHWARLAVPGRLKRVQLMTCKANRSCGRRHRRCNLCQSPSSVPPVCFSFLFFFDDTAMVC